MKRLTEKQSRHSLTTQIVVWVVGFVSVLFVTALYIMFHYARESIYQEAMEKARQTLRTTELRIDNTFPFQSLTMEVIQTIFPEGKTTSLNRTCPLIDEDGNIKGGGVSLFLYTFLLNDVSLNQGDSLHISVVHCMKREIMPGVIDVGISLTKQ